MFSGEFDRSRARACGSQAARLPDLAGNIAAKAACLPSATSIRAPPGNSSTNGLCSGLLSSTTASNQRT